MKSRIVIAAILVSACAAAGAQPAAIKAPGAGSKPAVTTAMSEGEVRKVDMAAAKITLRHGPLVNLDMPAMTMAFRVSDPKLLAVAKKGDKVRFVAENIDGQLTVTRLQAAK